MSKKILSFALCLIMVLALVGTASGTEMKLNEGLITYLSFDEDVKEGKIKDLSGKNNFGILVGTAEVKNGILGMRSKDVPKDNWGVVKLQDGLADSLTDMTISIWVKQNVVEKWQGIVALFNPANYMILASNMEGGWDKHVGDTGKNAGLSFGLTTEGWGSAQSVGLETSNDQGKWNHLVVTLEKDTAIFYKNGEEIARNEKFTLDPKGMKENHDIVTESYIGRSVTGNETFVDGFFDEFRLYNRALSKTEVQGLASIAPGKTETTDDAVEINVVQNFDNKEIEFEAGLAGEYVPGPDLVTFPDIQDHWSKEFVEKVGTAGVVGGYPDGTFQPENQIKLAEYLKMVIVGSGLRVTKYSPNDCYDDVAATDWFADYMQTAKDFNLVAPEMLSGNNVNPNKLVNREEMAYIITKAYIAKTKTEVTANDVNKYADGASISDWAKETVGQSDALGFIKGRDTGEFAPQDNGKRGEVATIIARLLVKLAER